MSILFWAAGGVFLSIAEREMGTSRHRSSGHAHLSVLVGPKVAKFLVTTLFRSLVNMLSSINSSIASFCVSSGLNPNQFASPKARWLCSSVTSQKMEYHLLLQDTLVWVPFLLKETALVTAVYRILEYNSRIVPAAEFVFLHIIT